MAKNDLDPGLGSLFPNFQIQRQMQQASGSPIVAGNRTPEQHEFFHKLAKARTENRFLAEIKFITVQEQKRLFEMSLSEDQDSKELAVMLIEQKVFELMTLVEGYNEAMKKPAGEE